MYAPVTQATPRALALQDRLLSQEPEWSGFYNIHNEYAIPSDEHPGKQRKCIDLAIVFVAGRGRPEFVLEAKQLNHAKSYQRAGNYTGAEAMKRFLSGDYAAYTARFPEVGMLGYVLSDSVGAWRDRLKAAIKDKGPTLAPRRPQQDVRSIADFPLEWTSGYNQQSTSLPVMIYHIFASFMDTDKGEPYDSVAPAAAHP